MDLFLRILTAALLFFAPLAFAGTEPWAYAVIQGGVSCALILLLSGRKTVYITPLFKPVFFIFAFLTLLALLQSVFPATVLGAPYYRPITLVPLYSLESAGIFFTWLGLAFLVSQLFHDRRHIVLFVIALLACCALTALTIIASPEGRYLSWLLGVDGGIGPFLNRNHAGVFLGMGAVLTAVYMFYNYYDALKNHAKKPSYYILQLSLGLLCSGLIFLTVYTRSRGAMLALGAAFFLLFLFYIFALLKNRALRFKLLAVWCFVLIMSSFLIYKNLQAVNEYAVRSVDNSSSIRLKIYEGAFEMLKDFPVFGAGIGAMPVALPLYSDLKLKSYIEHLHNDWLEIMLGAGYLGAAVILCGLIWFFAVYFKNIKKLGRRKKVLYLGFLSVLFLMGAASLVDYHFFIPANAFVFFSVLGLLCSPSFFEDKTKTVNVNIIFKAAVIVLCIGLFYIPVSKTIAWRYLLFSRDMPPQTRLEYHIKAAHYYDSPRYGARLAREYLRQNLRERANEAAAEYLKKYPEEKELSSLYTASKS